MTSCRYVRWSRNIRIDDGSLTFASGPSFSSKKIAAIGVTYSCEKRQSVRKKPLSPGFTHGTPVTPFAASVTSFRAKIFSAIVIGRRGAPPGLGLGRGADRATGEGRAPAFETAVPPST